MSAAAIVVAGGQGTRMGAALPKQYLRICGVPVLLRAVRPFLEHPGIDQTIVVLPPSDAAAPPEWLSALDVRIAAGGAHRGDSVWNGLAAVDQAVQTVLVHDGARPFVDAPMISRVLQGAASGGAIAAIAVSDTLKEVDADGMVIGTPDRSRFWRAQTPQGFPRETLMDAYRAAREAGFSGTDDAAIFAWFGGTVRVVQGSGANIKVTHPEDLVLAERLAEHSLP